MIPDSIWNSAVADEPAYCWERVPGKLLHEFRKAIELFMFQAGIDPVRVRSASAVSSIGVFPARSPIPSTVEWTTSTPSANARNRVGSAHSNPCESGSRPLS